MEGYIIWVSGCEPVFCFSVEVFLEACIGFHFLNKIGWGSFGIPADDPCVDLNAVCMCCGEALLKLIAIGFLSKGGGEETAGVVGTSEGLRFYEKGVDAHLFKFFAGTVPVSGVEPCSCWLPDGSGFEVGKGCLLLVGLG